MKKIIKLQLGIVVCALFFAAFVNASGITLKNEMTSSINNERFIEVTDSTILLKLWDEQQDNDEILPYYSKNMEFINKQ